MLCSVVTSYATSYYMLCSVLRCYQELLHAVQCCCMLSPRVITCCAVLLQHICVIVTMLCSSMLNVADVFLHVVQHHVTKNIHFVHVVDITDVITCCTVLLHVTKSYYMLHVVSCYIVL